MMWARMECNLLVSEVGSGCQMDTCGFLKSILSKSPHHVHQDNFIECAHSPQIVIFPGDFLSLYTR